MSFQNQRVVIVGGTSGIGLAAAKSFVAQGAAVVVASRSQAKVDEAKQALGAQVQGHVLDFRSEDDTKAFFAKVGTFDHLVVTAGGAVMGPFDTLPTADVRAAFDSKFWGQYLTVKAALPYIQKTGSITLTSGVYGSRPPQGASTLAAINSAVEGLVRGLAVDLAPIRVNVVSPGLVDTPIYSGMDAASRQAMFQHVADTLPVKHIAQAEEIAEAYVYLAKNTFTTGTVIQIEGGALLS
ncbi:SDR family oxidoreductase [Alicyclobacillus cycloheptanicus]|uniref:NAD(P)-dependent dehydrogenase (Short-subunit alcohol dehydrogenase family) n=1 Tax=Alicyclobacillus cycloheptanicus TaxID=1457 RepID=A0ABT9XKT9_9BACL|nr:SDR family oxidoreductase [Alicyclobacillus cycloheptanicus]MDQ0190351.1 NAD(P)-dependent dehydrogenase (short-subunit alcohol dehydrogenase family) [Alicyclobacillus cycloheptanicus]WDM00012.1 SDR family oxidoreductase [Alicyclobacillus cycloheptanicus]